MAQIKFSYGKYGIDKSKEPTQSLNVRIFHSNLDYRRTLKLDISREGYDFEKDHITDLSKGSRSEEEAKYLQSNGANSCRIRRYRLHQKIHKLRRNRD